MSIVIVHDATHANIGHLPEGPAAGYTTGTGGIRWTDADWHNHPGAVRICQDSGTDHTADVLDDENRAATDQDAAVWVPKALAAFKAATRPGQRRPAVYKSASGITALVNTLIAHKITSGVGLWVANWGLTKAEAFAGVVGAAGPFPIIGVQYANRGLYDTSAFSGTWLADVSVAGPHKHLTRNGDTIASLAASRGMSVKSWVALQDRLGADVHALAAGPLPPGVTWLSVNP